eukprot:Gb_30421 [translate_table: standard]
MQQGGPSSPSVRLIFSNSLITDSKLVPLVQESTSFNWLMHDVRYCITSARQIGRWPCLWLTILSLYKKGSVFNHLVTGLRGKVYPQAIWMTDRFKEHCLVSQMAGRNFPVPSLLVIICMDALGPPRWIEPNEAPRLNDYIFFHKKKGVKKDKRANSYLGKFYLTLRQIKDGLEASRKLPEYIKKKWKEALWMEDDQATYISFAAANAAGVRKEAPV